MLNQSHSSELKAMLNVIAGKPEHQENEQTLRELLYGPSKLSREEIIEVLGLDGSQLDEPFDVADLTDSEVQQL